MRNWNKVEVPGVVTVMKDKKRNMLIVFVASALVAGVSILASCASPGSSGARYGEGWGGASGHGVSFPEESG